MHCSRPDLNLYQDTKAWHISDHVIKLDYGNINKHNHLSFWRRVYCYTSSSISRLIQWHDDVEERWWEKRETWWLQPLRAHLDFEHICPHSAASSEARWMIQIGPCRLQIAAANSRRSTTWCMHYLWLFVVSIKIDV
jgi:hypothetical protein